MLLIGILVFVAFLLSSTTVRRALPLESLVVIGVMAFVTLALFETGRLG